MPTYAVKVRNTVGRIVGMVMVEAPAAELAFAAVAECGHRPATDHGAMPFPPRYAELLSPRWRGRVLDEVEAHAMAVEIDQRLESVS